MSLRNCLIFVFTFSLIFDTGTLIRCGRFTSAEKDSNSSDESEKKNSDYSDEREVECPDQSETHRREKCKRTDNPRGLNTCIQFCCPEGNAWDIKSTFCSLDESILDNNKLLESLAEKLNDDRNELEDKENVTVGVDDFFFIAHDPCSLGWMVSEILNDYKLSANGSIYDGYRENELPFDEYCLFYESGSKSYSAKICNRAGSNEDWDAFFAIFAILAILALICGYYPSFSKLGVIHRQIFYSYSITFLLLYVSGLGREFTPEDSQNAYLFTIYDILTVYGYTACSLWLNVMGFTIWRSLRASRLDDNHTRSGVRRYLWHAFYAWTVPAIFVACCEISLDHFSYFRNEKFAWNFRARCYFVFITVIFLVNAVLSVSTSIKFVKYKKRIANLPPGTERENDERNKPWFTLGIKMFTIMTGDLMIYVLTEATYLLASDDVEVREYASQHTSEAIMLFTFLVWKQKLTSGLKSLCCRRKKKSNENPAPDDAA